MVLLWCHGSGQDTRGVVELTDFLSCMCLCEIGPQGTGGGGVAIPDNDYYTQLLAQKWQQHQQPHHPRHHHSSHHHSSSSSSHRHSRGGVPPPVSLSRPLSTRPSQPLTNHICFLFPPSIDCHASYIRSTQAAMVVLLLPPPQVPHQGTYLEDGNIIIIMW